MLKKQTLIVLVIALVIALLAVWFAKRWVERSAPSAVLNTTKILVAAKDLAYATKLSEAEFKVVDWPTSNLPSAYFTQAKEVVNKITTRAIMSGEVLSKHTIREYVGGNPLSALIQPDMRAVSVKVNDVIGVSGFLLPGNFVDVLATPKIRTYAANNAKLNTPSTPTTYIAVQNVKVLAVDQETGGDKNKPAVHKSVTLEVSPAQATKLVYATLEGTIQLLLRNPLDKTVATLPSDAKPEPAPPVIKPEPKPEPTPEPAVKPEAVKPERSWTVIRGATKSITHCSEVASCTPINKADSRARTNAGRIMPNASLLSPP